MKRLVVAVDCDNVLVLTMPFFVDAYNRTYGTNVTLDKVNHNNDPLLWGVDQAGLAVRLAALMDTDEYRQLRPSDEAIVTLKRLSEHHELHIITSRRPHERELTQHMLDAYMPGIFTSLELVGFTGSKGEVCQRMRAEILIDDTVSHLQDGIKHGIPQDNVILFGDYAWNKQESLQTGMKSYYTWSEVETRVNDIASK